MDAEYNLQSLYINSLIKVEQFVQDYTINKDAQWLNIEFPNGSSLVTRNHWKGEVLNYAKSPTCVSFINQQNKA